jgi:hypothetical protein
MVYKPTYFVKNVFFQYKPTKTGIFYSNQNFHAFWLIPVHSPITYVYKILELANAMYILS